MQENDQAYAKGLIDGLETGTDVLKRVLEQELTQQDVLDEYNLLMRETYHAYQQLIESNKHKQDPQV